MLNIIDTHAHLYDLSDPVAILADCAAAGVSDVVALGVDWNSNKKHFEILRHLSDDKGSVDIKARPEREQCAARCAPSSFPKVHLALGLHPGNITTPQATQECFTFMRETLHGAKAGSDPGQSYVSSVVALGETGLDFWYKGVRKNDTKKHEQREVFDRHLAIARDFNLPVVIHSRGAWRESLAMTLASGVRKAEFHWYSGPLDVLKDILDAGFFISVTPALSYSEELRKAAEFAPLDRIMIETDTPVVYRLSSQGMEEGPAVGSTPRDVWRTLALLGALKKRPDHDVLAQVNRNAREFFRI